MLPVTACAPHKSAFDPASELSLRVSARTLKRSEADMRRAACEFEWLGPT